jgi:hypothetical protein
LERAYTACADGKIANNGCTMDELGVSVPTTSTSGEWHFVVAGGSSSNQCNGRTAISSSYNFICAYEHGYAKGDSDYPALVSFRSGPGQRWTHRCQWTTTDQKKLCQSISASGYEVPNSAS